MKLLHSMRPPKLPREHGGWAMLGLPIVLGLALTGFRPSSGWWIAPAALLVYLAHEAWAGRGRRGGARPTAVFLRRLAWGAVYLGAGGAAFVAAWRGTPASCERALLTIAGVAAVLGTVHASGSLAGRRRATGVELTGMAAMALTAPMIAAASGAWDGARPVAAVALAASYFVSSLVYVRAYDRHTRSFGDRASRCVRIHALLVFVLGALWVAGVVPAMGLLAFAPVLGRVAWSLVRPPADLRKLGLREVWVVGSFAVLASVALAI